MDYFYVGLHQPSDARHFERCMISYNRLKTRKSDFIVNEWMMDSGAFTQVALKGGYDESPEVYARAIKRWSNCGNLVAAVSQDWMCEAFVLDKTGLTTVEHQRLTIERYDAIRACVPSSIHVIPVLQGYQPQEYAQHIRQYGERLTNGMWVGVGSVCKRNSDVGAIEAVLLAIKRERPDLYLHGFGVKTTALRSGIVQECLHSADSMAWSFAARRTGGNANNWREAKKFVSTIDTIAYQQAMVLF